MYRKKEIFLISLTLLNVGVLAFILLVGFQNKSLFTSVETKELILRHPNSKKMIKIGFEKDEPQIVFLDENSINRLQLQGGPDSYITVKNTKDKTIAQMHTMKETSAFCLYDPSGDKRLQLQGGFMPGLSLYNKDQKLLVNLMGSNDLGPILSLRDQNQIARLQLEVGQKPTISMKNDLDKTIGTWTMTSDGGSALGLADQAGSAATILKGGNTPSMLFYHQHIKPSASIGIVKDVPHLFIGNRKGSDGVLLNGGDLSSMMVLDEKGQMKVFISKHGVFQGQEAKPQENSKFLVQEDEEKELLFPDSVLR